MDLDILVGRNDLIQYIWQVKEVRSTPQCKVEVKEAVRMGLKKQKVRPKEGCVFVGNVSLEVLNID